MVTSKDPSSFQQHHLSCNIILATISSFLSYDIILFVYRKVWRPYSQCWWRHICARWQDNLHPGGNPQFLALDPQLLVLNSLILNSSSSIPWYLILNSSFLILDSSSLVLDPQLLVLDPWSLILNSSSSIPRSWSSIPHSWSLILNSSSLILDTWSSILRPQFLDTWSLIPWSLILNSSSSIPWYLILDSSFLILDPWFLVLDPWPSIPRHWSLVLYHDPWQWQILWRDDLDPDDKWKLKSGCCSLSPCSAIVLWCYIARVLLWVEIHWVLYIGWSTLGGLYWVVYIGWRYTGWSILAHERSHKELPTEV